MKLKLERRWPKKTYTIGRLYVNGELFCNTLEDAVADLNKNGRFDGAEKKVYGETAIPYGTYKIIYNWSPRFGRNLPRLIDVNHYEGVLIHPGNSTKDTLVHRCKTCIIFTDKIFGKVGKQNDQF